MSAKPGNMSIGAMRDTVALQQPTRPVADSFGQRAPAFATVATVAAKVQQTSGQEMTQAQTQREVIRYTITIRHYPGLSSSWQLLFNGTTIFVQSVTNPDGRGRFDEITGTAFSTPGGVI